MKKIKAVIFDLDGTLLNTLEDLFNATNFALKNNGYPECTIEEVRSFVGNGFKKLIERALKKNLATANFDKVFLEGKNYYSQHNLDSTAPYPGIYDLFENLKNDGIKIAVVSNKPDADVKSLCKYFFADFVTDDLAVGENEALGIKKKPSPESVLHILKKLNLSKDQALYVGDSEVDIQTAKNAGLKCVSVAWGFKSIDFLKENGASHIIQKAEELLEFTKEDFTLASDSLLEELDYFRIQKKVASFCKSQESEEELLKERPLFKKDFISERKDLGREWTFYISKKGQSAIKPWPQVEDLFSVLNVQGSQLKKEELFALGLFASSVESLRSEAEIILQDENLPLLKKYIFDLPSLSEAKKAVFEILDEDGQIKNLPSIRNIKAQIASLKNQIENALKKYTSDSTIKDALQSNVAVLRNERQLLAVRSDHRNFVDGIVHEVSPSGQTLYIEPIELIKANNSLFEEEAKLNSELKKIFKELTEKLSFYKNDFEEAFKIMILLDKCHAAALYQKETSSVFAEDINEDDEEKCTSKIIQAKHPLLGEKAVGVDINFMKGKRVLIITGPNTGGKTVTLKTIALFVLLNQSGFPINAGEGSRLEIFNSLFADIGDEQSIDESLSTFSAHMKKMGQIISYANNDSLVLLDELGSGTDPLEGSAIAMACLDNLLEKNSFVIVTTHHGVLKNYGWTNEKCINASVEFDNKNLKPTYKLLMGIPGESHALDIAESSGLSKEVVAKARSYISNQQADVSSLIKGLNQKHLEMEEMIYKEKEKANALEEKELKLKEKELKLSQRQLELDKAEKKESSVFLTETRKKLENLVRELREGEITREKTLKVKNFISGLEDDVEGLEKKLVEKEESLKNQKENLLKEKEFFAQNGMRISKAKEGKSSSNKKTKKHISNSQALLTSPSYIFKREGEDKKIQLKEGMEVYAGSAKREGILLHKEKNDEWLVQFGSMKMKVKENLICPVPEKFQEAKTLVYVERVKDENDKNEKPLFELRLLGMRYEEAMKALEKQLDLCTLNNFKNFSIIHGKGNGVLQQAVHNFLSHYPGVKNFYFAQPEDGGSGKTYVELF